MKLLLFILFAISIILLGADSPSLKVFIVTKVLGLISLGTLVYFVNRWEI